MHSFMVALLLAVPVSQEAGRPAAPPTKWSFGGRVEGEFQYNSNVWLLDSGHKDRLERNLASDQVSGRYDDMESADDLIFRPSVRVDLKGPSPLGRKVDLWAGLAWEQYVQNPKRSHLETEIGVGQWAGSRGRFELELDFLPQYFNKNYLADGVDTSGNGNISSDERIYEPGECREWELRLEYRHHLIDRGPADAFGLAGKVALGYRDRSYDDPFPGRDEKGTWVRLGLQFEHLLGAGGGKSKGTLLKWGVFYKYEAVDSPIESEVVLLDEAAFGVDFSADGDLTDTHARVLTPVDRSRIEHEIGLSAEIGLTPTLDVGIKYAHTIHDFSGNETLDVNHTGRQDERDEVELYLKVELSKGWNGKLGYEWREQTTDRPEDSGATSDSFDYKRNVFAVSLTCRW